MKSLLVTIYRVDKQKETYGLEPIKFTTNMYSLEPLLNAASPRYRILTKTLANTLWQLNRTLLGGLLARQGKHDPKLYVLPIIIVLLCVLVTSVSHLGARASASPDQNVPDYLVSISLPETQVVPPQIVMVHITVTGIGSYSVATLTIQSDSYNLDASSEKIIGTVLPNGPNVTSTSPVPSGTNLTDTSLQNIPTATGLTSQDQPFFSIVINMHTARMSTGTYNIRAIVVMSQNGSAYVFSDQKSYQIVTSFEANPLYPIIATAVITALVSIPVSYLTSKRTTRR